jgi:hypothetical protein
MQTHFGWWNLSLLAGFLVALTGCGSGASTGLVPAKGTVTYKGKPVEGATVTFVFPDKQVSTGITDANGQFTLTTGGRPGAPVGKAKVAITKQTGGPSVGKAPDQLTPEDMMKMYAASGGGDAMKKAAQEVKSEIPEQYGNPDTSNLVADVLKSGDNTFQFNLQ